MLIGAHLLIDQDLRGAPNWEFNMIGLDGQSYRFNDTPGDVIFFEASMVPHGRMQSLQGEGVLSAFIAFDSAYHVRDEL